MVIIVTGVFNYISILIIFQCIQFVCNGMSSNVTVSNL